MNPTTHPIGTQFLGREIREVCSGYATTSMSGTFPPSKMLQREEHGDIERFTVKDYSPSGKYALIHFSPFQSAKWVDVTLIAVKEILVAKRGRGRPRKVKA